MHYNTAQLQDHVLQYISNAHPHSLIQHTYRTLLTIHSITTSVGLATKHVVNICKGNTVLTVHFIRIIICDQICQKGSYTCTVSRQTFHHHLLATSMYQQDMCLLLLKVEQSAFTQAFFSSLSGVHECSGSL